jgi:WD40 repeat protein
MVSYSDDNSAKLWKFPSGEFVKTLEGSANKILTTALSPDQEHVVISANRALNVYNLYSGELVRSIKYPEADVSTLKFNKQGNILMGISRNKKIVICDFNGGKILNTLSGHTESISNLDLSPREDFAITASFDSTVRIWDMRSGKQIGMLSGEKNQMTYAKISNTGVFIVTAASPAHLYTENKTSIIWDKKSGRQLYVVIGQYARFTPDDQYLIANLDFKTNVYEVSSGKLLHTLSGVSYGTRVFTPDGRAVLLKSGTNVNAVDVETGKTVFTLSDADGWAEYSENNKYIIADDKKVKLWDARSRNLSYETTLSGSWQDFSRGAEIGISIQTTRFYMRNLAAKSEEVTFVSLDNDDWVVTHPSGLFDASPGAMEKLYFTQGMDIIEFSQLKERFFEPGLWRKVMAGEELRNVEAFDKIELPPDFSVCEVSAAGVLNLKLHNRGGGIGEISVLINGKEVIRDARPDVSKSNMSELTLEIPLTKFSKNLIPGRENFVAVKGWNAGHWVVSRAKLATYTPPTKAQINPTMYLIACGVSDYTGEQIDLKFAAKDAQDMSQAITIGARNLFGTDRLVVKTLTTNQPREAYPTKQNIVNAFREVAERANSSDVVVVYFAGHGITWGGQDGDFYYLTQNAYTALPSAYNDPAIRSSSTLSSSELVDLFKTIPAQKQVLMIDACGSGKVVDNLMAKRSIPASTLRALDRMKDRTGMHIITGCAADAVSYEASQFGQGILTYSILEGIRGAALREEKFIDVNQLFQYAQERVPVLVSGVGGIQTPQVFSPFGAQSFDIGQVNSNDKKAIPIARIRPVFVRSSFINKSTLDDNLSIGKSVDEKLDELAAKASDAPLIFVNVLEYPEGCKISGLYEQGSVITAELKVKCNDGEKKYTVSSADLNELMTKIIRIVAPGQ